MSDFAVQPLKVAVDGGEEDGLLVLHGGALVSVLVCLDEPFYEDDRGRWHLELGPGACSAHPRTFATLAAALRWIAGRLGVDPTGAELTARLYVNRGANDA